jgi:hypothetical protein
MRDSGRESDGWRKIFEARAAGDLPGSDPSHDFLHIRHVAAKALTLAAAEEGLTGVWSCLRPISMISSRCRRTILAARTRRACRRWRHPNTCSPSVIRTLGTEHRGVVTNRPAPRSPLNRSSPKLTRVTTNNRTQPGELITQSNAETLKKFCADVVRRDLASARGYQRLGTQGPG